MDRKLCLPSYMCENVEWKNNIDICSITRNVQSCILSKKNQKITDRNSIK